jgi:hypothetical protein
MCAGHFSNQFYDFGDDLGMRFVRAEATKIPDLVEFRGKCMPNFVFYLDGQQVAKIEGPNIVDILKTIQERAPKLK